MKSPPLDAAIGVGSVAIFSSASTDGRGEPLDRPPEPPWFVPYDNAVRVGSDEPEAIALVRRAEVPRAKTRPLRIEPEAGKVGQHVTQPSRAQSRHVLADEEGGAELFDDARNFRPEPARVGLSATLAGNADGLAGETTTDDIHIGKSISTLHLAYIVESDRVGPVTPQHFAAVRIDFRLCDRAPHSSALEPEVEHAHAGEERHDPAFAHSALCAAARSSMSRIVSAFVP